MSTISGLNPSSNQDALYGLLNSANGGYLDASQVALTQATTETTQASVSLSANLSGVTAGTAAGQLTLAFAQALQGATEVDPGTGQLELASGANAQLTATFTKLLQQSGFSSDQASAAAASLESQLAQGGDVSLSASYAQDSSVSASLSSTYGSGAASSVSALDTTQRAGSIVIGVDLATGQLSVDLTSQNISSYQAQGEISGSGSSTLSGPVAQALSLSGAGDQASGSLLSASGNNALDTLAQSLGVLLPTTLGGSGNASANAASTTTGAASPLNESGSETSVVVESLSATLIEVGAANYGNNTGASGDAGGGSGAQGTADSLALTATESSVISEASSGAQSNAQAETAPAALQQLVAELNSAKVLSEAEVSSLLQGLAQLATASRNTAQANGADETDGTSASDAASANGTGSTGSTQSEESSYTSVQVSVTQTLALRQLDGDGYGSTLFKRPDGSLGRISTSPLHLTA